jgi:protein-tyrosine phosphatase
MATTKILMVCLGNICRSPLAQGILKKKVFKSVIIDSAGTAGYHIGKNPDQRSIDIGNKNGVDISNYKARQFSKEDFKNFDHIYVMDNSNYKDVIGQAESIEDEKKVNLILSSNQEVPDPYYLDEKGFKNCYRLLDNACENIVKELNL